MLRAWEASVKEVLLPGLHGHQAKALAAVSFGMLAGGGCSSRAVSPSVPGRARPASVRRRLERLVANGRLWPAEAMGMLARSVMSGWSGRTAVLVLDETPRGPWLERLEVSACYRGRAVPLAWECYEADRPPVPMPRLAWRLLRRVARAMPPGVEVVLLADRGLSWPAVADCCRALGWHFVLRVQGQTKVRPGARREGGGAREARADELAPRKGARWYGRGEVFKGAGWREANVAAVWEEHAREPWLLVTDLPASYARCRQYAKRMWCEPMHRDEKTAGLNWQASRVTDPRRQRRLLVAMALALQLAQSLGTWALKRGLRRALESTRRRKLSLFSLGARWLRHAILSGADAPCTPYLVPP
jgi:hypothetical protein